LDVQIFGKYIAQTLDITVRFIGEELGDMITGQYNEHMKRILPSYRIKCIEIPRLKNDGAAISASIVRAKLAAGNLNDIESMVPSTAFEYLKRNEHTLRSKIKDMSRFSGKLA